MTPVWVRSGDLFEKAEGFLILTVTPRRSWWAASVRHRSELVPVYTDEFDTVELAMRAAQDAVARLKARRETSMG